MIKKICFFSFDNFYSSKRHFTKCFAEAFERMGVETLIIDSVSGTLSREEYSEILRFSPDCTFSFNTMEPDGSGKYLWDHLEIPHILHPLDPMIYYLEYAKSPYCRLAYVDRKDKAVLENAGCTSAFFLPHGVERSLIEKPIQEKKEFEIVLIGSCYDHLSVRAAWEKEYSKEVCSLIEESIEMTLAEPYTSFLEALVSCWNNFSIDPRSVSFESLAFYIDYYLRGYDRLKLIESLKGFKIDIFGDCFWVEGKSVTGWERYTDGMKNVTIHKGVPFGESLDILSKARLCLNSTPFFKDGSHERYLTGLGAGCPVLASDNLYGKETFGDLINWYSFNKWEEVPDTALDLLSQPYDPNPGRNLINQSHTWDSRAEAISSFF